MLSIWVKVTADDILKYFPKKIGFDISCKLSPWETICIKCKHLHVLSGYLYMYTAAVVIIISIRSST